jgi:hypothetical protein
VRAGTSSAAAALPIARRSGYLLSAATAALLLGGIALASPAAAVDDPAKPDARITHGPSCHPGGVVVEVTGGTADYDVVFATTRSPGGEDSARVPAGTTVVLRTDGVAWGETIDGRLEYTPVDGAGGSFVDELEGYTFTRPAEEDCAAIAAPAAAATVPQVEPEAEVGTSPAGAPDPSSGTEGAAGTDPAAADVRPDGTRPGGTDAASGPATTAARKAEVPGTAAPVELVETAAAAAPLPASSSLAPLVAAALALVAATAGLAGVLGRTRRLGRRSTGSA